MLSDVTAIAIAVTLAFWLRGHVPLFLDTPLPMSYPLLTGLALGVVWLLSPALPGCLRM